MVDRIADGLIGCAFVIVGAINVYAGAAIIYRAIRKEV